MTLITSYLEAPEVKAVRLTCLDLSKAFERVHHGTPINLLLSSNIEKGFIVWLVDYLTFRFQKVKVKNSCGPLFQVPSGVPQGSILGPYLFASFMGSLNVPPPNKIIIYADDIILLEPLPCCHDNVSAICSWICDNKLTLNVSKSRQMIIPKVESLPFDPSYPTIQTVCQMKVLGVHWTADLKWDHHFDVILKCASRRLYIIRVLKTVLPRIELISVYFTLVVPVILYASPLICHLSFKIRKRLDIFQNRAHRLICGSHCDCSLLPDLSSLRKSRVLKFLHKCEIEVDHVLHDLIPTRLPRSGKFCLPCCATSRRMHSFVPYSCLIANNFDNFLI